MCEHFKDTYLEGKFYFFCFAFLLRTYVLPSKNNTNHARISKQACVLLSNFFCCSCLAYSHIHTKKIIINCRSAYSSYLICTLYSFVVFFSNAYTQFSPFLPHLVILPCVLQTRFHVTYALFEVENSRTLCKKICKTHTKLTLANI